MTSNLQLISFLVLFFYGVFFYLLTILNFRLLKDVKVYIEHLLTFVYVLDMTIIYILIFYHLNKGYFHIYFILMVFVGFFVMMFLHHKYGKRVKMFFKKRFTK